MAGFGDWLVGILAVGVTAVLGGVAVKNEVDKADGDWSVATSNIANNINVAMNKEIEKMTEQQKKAAEQQKKATIKKARLIINDNSGKYSEAQKEKAQEFLSKYGK